jgi:hypothetical protein
MLKLGQRVYVNNIPLHLLNINYEEKLALCEHQTPFGKEVAEFDLSKIRYNRIEPKTICIDFDGTCVTHDFPRIGKSIGAEEVLKELATYGHRLILWTMRSNKTEVKSTSPEINSVADNYLDYAVNWFKKNNIPLYGINTNPTQNTWTDSPKAYSNFVIDDTAIGCPLKYDDSLSPMPFADWAKIKTLLIEKHLL